MRIFKWKSLVELVLVGVCFGSPVRALADDADRDKPSASPAGVKTDAASSGLNQTASDSTGSGTAPRGKGADVSEAEQSLVASDATSQEPKRRALPAPLDGIFPGADYLGPTPLIGVPDTDPVYPLTRALWSVAPALKDARIKLYGWVNAGISVSTSNKSN